MSADPAPPERLGRFVLKRVNQALREFDMIRPDDRIAVAVSGGKDSLALLWLLQLKQRSRVARFSLAAVHVLGDAGGVTPPHSPLMEWLEQAGIPRRIVEPPLSDGETLPLTCLRCALLRRQAIFRGAAELGCNVVALAHNADDAAQTTLLNLLYGGRATTFPPSADYFGGCFRLIRPLIYVPESDTRRLARALDFPPPPPACSRSGDTGRQRVAEMLKLLGRDYLRQARNNLIRAGLRGAGS